SSPHQRPCTRHAACPFWTRSSEPEAEGVSAVVTRRADRHTRSTIYPGFLAKPGPNKQNSKNAAIHETRITPNQLTLIHVSSGRGSGSFRRSCCPPSQTQLDPFPPSLSLISCFDVYEIYFIVAHGVPATVGRT